MREPDVQIVRASDVRRSLTRPGDIRTEIGFQNDINALLARFDEVRVPWQALAGPTPTLRPSVVADTTPIPSPARPAPRLHRIDVTMPRLRVLDGGVAPTLGLLTITAPPQPAVRATSPTPSPSTTTTTTKPRPRRRA